MCIQPDLLNQIIPIVSSHPWPNPISRFAPVSLQPPHPPISALQPSQARPLSTPLAPLPTPLQLFRPTPHRHPVLPCLPALPALPVLPVLLAGRDVPP